MKNIKQLSPEELSLKLMAEWFDSVSNEDFLNEFNSLGNNYSGVTIGVFLQENGKLESISNKYIIKSNMTNVFHEFEHSICEHLTKGELHSIELIPTMTSKDCGMSTRRVHTKDQVYKDLVKMYDAQNESLYALAA